MSGVAAEGAYAEALAELSRLRARVQELEQSRATAPLPAITQTPPAEPTEEELLSTEVLEHEVALVAATHNLELNEQDLPPGAVDGIRRQRLAAIPPEIAVPPAARQKIDRLIALRTGLAVVSALRSAELTNDPATRELADQVSMDAGKPHRPLNERITAIVYFYGRKQGLTEAEINAAIDRAAKAPR